LGKHLVIDLHCHILPGIDDGASDLSVSLGMARAAVDQGVSVIACTPHILPGLYHNSGPAIRKAVQDLQQVLDENGIALQLVTGADVHMTPDFVGGLTSGHLLSLADSRYVLVEPPHHTAPPQLEEFFFNMTVAGYVPILTHPERLSWVPSRYETIKKLVRAGVWMQITAGSFTGAFGRNALYWAQRMLDDGCVHLVASDAHDVNRRPPDLAAGFESVAKRIGVEEAQRLVLTRPMAILGDESPSSLPEPLGVADAGRTVLEAEARSQRLSDDSVDMHSAGRSGLSGRLRRFFR
jgi:protein-tyrosine phosphatase